MLRTSSLMKLLKKSTLTTVVVTVKDNEVDNTSI